MELHLPSFLHVEFGDALFITTHFGINEEVKNWQWLRAIFFS